MSTEVTAFLLAQLAQNSGWNTSQVASKGLTTPVNPLFPRFHAKCLIPKKADSHPGSATNFLLPEFASCRSWRISRNAWLGQGIRSPVV
jgi:hypothetical protein